jgi:hypothetical protein
MTWAVEIVGARHAISLGRADEGFDQLVLAADAGDVQRAAVAVNLVVAKLSVVLNLDEIRQHFARGPAGTALLLPAVVVLFLAADDDQPVDRARAAQHPAARPIDLTAGHVRLRLGLEFPIDLRVPHRAPVADGEMNPQVSVARSRLDHCNLRVRIGAQPIG